jgi:penicillin-binding protein 1A
VRESLNLPDDPETALVAVDPNTGAVRAMVGGRHSFSQRQINLATQGHRQPGSSFKPFVLAAALDENLSIKTKFPAPASIKLETGFEPWTVDNYDGRDYGTLDLLQATANSVNTVYAQLILKIGPSKVVTAAHAAGILSKMSAVPSLALGTNTVTPLEMAGAYATFATGGMSNETYLVSKVTDANKKVLFERKPRRSRGLAERTANTVAYAMKQVIEHGTGRRADIGRPAAGKTGTTEEHADAWFGGFTPDLATVVWMGYPQRLIPMNDVHGIQVVGGSFPARIWHDFMIKALENVPPKDFGKPSFSGDTPTITPSASPSGSTTPLPSPSVTIVPSPPGQKKKSPSPSPSPSPSSSASPSPAQSKPP